MLRAYRIVVLTIFLVPTLLTLFTLWALLGFPDPEDFAIGL